MFAMLSLKTIVESMGKYTTNFANTMKNVTIYTANE